jgi:hypothetical protein
MSWGSSPSGNEAGDSRARKVSPQEETEPQRCYGQPMHGMDVRELGGDALLEARGR